MRIEYNFRSGAEAVDVGSEEAKGGEEKGGEEGGVVSCLTELIAAQSVVKELSLRGNELDSLAGVAIARAVANNSSLKMLNLFDNRLGDEGAVAIAKALRFNMSMSCVSLCKNGVGDEGALAFAAVFQVSSGRRVGSTPPTDVAQHGGHRWPARTRQPVARRIERRQPDPG